ncbi:MAG TPA: PEP/pyruvate-binding domain-containing protein, partial [Chloroflexota bacterium]|nr:PEP/pyruvate-binding domain-containing protein [Chloroflexota bacterium]
AVVVQRQIDAAVAGVMFTANPLTGTRRQAVIDASPGLGEAVVSGAVTPDHFVVDVRSGAVLERRLGDKRLRIEALPDGGTRRIELPAEHTGAGEACLTEAQLRELARLAERVERYYGEPQDTEWAIDAAGTLWLLQARPITTLYPLPASALNDTYGGTAGNELRVYFSFNVAQGVYQPLTPMGIQAFRLLGGAIARGWGIEIADPVAGPRALVEAGHRLYLDITVPLRNRVGRRALRAALSQGEARTVALLDHLVDDPRLGPAGGSRVGTARAMARFALRSGVARGVLRALRNPDGARRRAERALERLHGAAALPESASAAERLDHFERLLTRAPREIQPHVVPLVIAGVGTFFLAQALLRGVATRAELDAVRRGLPHNPTTEMDLELWALAQRIRADEASAEVVRSTPVEELAAAYRAGSLPPVAQRGVAAFLEEYGDRGVAEVDLGVPRWADDPGHILGVLANYLSLEPAAEGHEAPDAQFRRVAKEAEALVGELARRAAARSRVRGRVVGFLLRRFRQLAGQREAPKVAIVKALYGGRALLAPVGRELAAAGRLEREEDVYLLTLTEARAAVAGTDQRPLARARREGMALEAQRRQIPRLILSDGTVPVGPAGPRAAATDGKALEGTGASAGTVTGVARVIMDPHGARLEPGEILVAPSTDPGWTPLFLTAGGLVMEMGGPMSHGAIVAREYGIPAVVGVPGATEGIRSGQTITVDGASGTVSLGE